MIESEFNNRILSTSPTADDSDSDESLRPKKINEYIGQDKVKDCLLYTSPSPRDS